MLEPAGTNAASTASRATAVLATLRKLGSKKILHDMTHRYGIHAPKAFGVGVGRIQQLGKQLGRDHRLAAALWKTGWYEARMLCAFVDDPALVTAAQMDRWARDFDNWAICDTMCFKLFDRSPDAWGRVGPWARRREEFIRRAGFALLAALAAHDKTSSDAPFLKGLALVEHGARDDRNFVKKGVSWALRAVGRRSPALRREALAVSRRLAESESPAARWVGRDGLRDLQKR